MSHDPGTTSIHLTICPNCERPMALRPDGKFTKVGPAWHECPLQPLSDARIREVQTQVPQTPSFPQWIDCQKNANTRTTVRTIPIVS